MDSDDVLGDEGRKALDACVKVKIIGRPERRKYDRKTSLERLHSCYGGSFPGGLGTWSFFDPLKIYDMRSGHNVSKMKRTYDIVEIYEALLRFDEISYVEKYPREGPDSSKSRELIDKRRADIKREYEEARRSPDLRLQYSWVVAQRKVRDCFAGNFAGDEPILEDKRNETYNITDIYDAVKCIDEEGNLLKYPEDDGPGSNELTKLIHDNRVNLIKENEETKRSAYAKEWEYSRSEAERRVRDCFAGTFLDDTGIFSAIKLQNKMTYDIFNIKTAVDYFDKKKLIDKYPEPGQGHVEKKQQVDEQRANIQKEYDLATSSTEIEHGSGFIIHDHSIITNKHVIQTFLDKEEEEYRIHISNAAIGELPCKVADHDTAKDLALLYCPELNLEQSGICPLQLSDQPLKAGMSVFCFGYPISHTGKTALFVDGKVSGFKEVLFGDPLVVLNISLNSGNSGGPVLRRIKSELKVVGVVKQKHTKEILTQDEIRAIVTNSTKTSFSAHDSSPVGAQISVEEVTLRLHNALMGTHSPFNFSNALQGQVVAKFTEDLRKKYA